MPIVRMAMARVARKARVPKLTNAGGKDAGGKSGEEGCPPSLPMLAVRWLWQGG